MDETVYRKTDLSERKVSTKLIELVMNRGCTDLNLNMSRTKGKFSKSLPKVITHLNVFWCNVNEQYKNSAVEELLNSCHNLEELVLNCWDRTLGKIRYKVPLLLIITFLQKKWHYCNISATPE